jgi:hypothetical protein
MKTNSKINRFLHKINPVIRVKMFLDSRIKKAVERNLNTIFHKYGDACVDHHMMSDSWAVIKVDSGPHSCYLKFITLGKKDLREVQQFMSRYENSHIDAAPDIEHQFNRDWLYY